MNKSNYVKTIPTRALKILIRFDIVVLLFIIANLIVGDYYPVSSILLSFLGVVSIGNSNWYVVAIIWMYLMTYICAVICKEKYVRLGVFLILGAVLYIYLFVISGAPSYCYDTIVCFSIGAVYALYADKIALFMAKNKTYPIICLATSSMLFYCLNQLERHVGSSIVKLTITEAKSIAFVFTIVVITMIFSIRNPILDFLGKYLFEIYILQRLPMLLFYNTLSQYKFIYFAVCFTITIVLAILYRKLEDFIFVRLVKKD